ncbi:MAG: copper resistance protein B [Pseudomonadota bacterium]
MRLVMCIWAAFWATTVVTVANAEAPEEPPPWSQADEIFGADAMRDARDKVLRNSGGQSFGFLLFNQFEHQFGDDDRFSWNGQANWGGDIHKLWFKSEGHIESGDDEAELQALYSRAVAPFWNLQVGLRQDFEPDNLTHFVVAANGLAPYWFEVDASLFVSDEGDVTTRIESEYELLITQRWILQPRIELNASGSDIASRQVASGFTDIDVGLRLRYAFRREFAPYLGVEWQSALGETRDMRSQAGEDTAELKILLGLRAWF